MILAFLVKFWFRVTPSGKSCQSECRGSPCPLGQTPLVVSEQFPESHSRCVEGDRFVPDPMWIKGFLPQTSASASET